MPLPFISGDPIDALAVSTENNITKLLRALCVPIQDLEDAMQQLLLDRSIDTAVGVQLDVIGEIVDQVRGGLVDDDYRRYIRARIVAHRSTGTFEDLIKVVDLIVYDDTALYTVKNEGAATVRMYIEHIAIPDALAAIVFKFAKDTKAGGVRIVVEWMRSAPAGIFRLDAGPGLDVGHLAGGLG